jgi:hypothetical protein
MAAPLRPAWRIQTRHVHRHNENMQQTDADSVPFSWLADRPEPTKAGGTHLGPVNHTKSPLFLGPAGPDERCETYG